MQCLQDTQYNFHVHFPSDGVAVVLYNTMSTFASMTAHDMAISAGQILLGIVSFFTVAGGGLVIGMIMGIITALITKTTSEVRGALTCIPSVNHDE